VAGCCECGDEPSVSDVAELVSWKVIGVWKVVAIGYKVF
jgi:hypothetical protein